MAVVLLIAAAASFHETLDACLPCCDRRCGEIRLSVELLTAEKRQRTKATQLLARKRARDRKKRDKGA